MNNRKIIIITRDTEEAYKKDYPLSVMMRGNEVETMAGGHLGKFEYAKFQYKDDESFGDWLDSINNYSNQLLEFIGKKEYNENWYDIPEKLVNLPYNVNSKPLYDKIQFGEDLIYLLYWNRTKRLVKEPGLLLSLVCKDCEIDKSTENLLYIHDEEWGIRGNYLLLKDSKLEYTKKHENVLEELKNYFKYVVAFQHVDIEGLYFNNILNCKFGCNQFSDKMGTIEDNSPTTDFTTLKEDIIKMIIENKEEK